MAEKAPRKKRVKNPFRGFVRNLIALHSERVGRGFITPEDSVEKTIKLADGSEYLITCTRTNGAMQDVDPWDFKAAAKSVKAA